MRQSGVLRSGLVKGHLENVSRKVLEHYIYRQVINDHVRGKSGIYALYRKDRLAYVGLASNLPSRVSQHLRDRHSDAWDRFSIYLTVNDAHMKELESLILRITQPKGNRMRGKFAGSEDLKPTINKDVADRQRAARKKYFGDKTSATRPVEPARRGKKAVSPLAP